MGRTTTVNLPDGTTATRTSASRVYTHAVLVTTDLHERAARLLAEAERIERHYAAAMAIVDAGDLTQFTRRATSWNGRGEAFYSSFVSPEHTRDTCGYWLPDYQRTESWEQYAADALARMAESGSKLRASAQELLAGPQFGYGIARWSARRDSAERAARGMAPCSEQRATVVECQQG